MLNANQVSYRTEHTIIASSIVQGHGFRSPYDERQPTAWVGPLYPCLVALVFRIFGIYCSLSIHFLVALNALFLGLTSLTIYAIGSRVFGMDVGATAAWLWAFCLPNRVMPLLLFETCLSALLLTVGFLLTLKLGCSTDYRQWGGAGLFWGVACLVNPALTAPLIFFWIFSWVCARKNGRNSWRQLALSVALFLAVLMPWFVRNYRVFGRPIFVRSNLAAEIYFGNVSFDSHPLGRTKEYQRLGEAAFIAEKKRLLEAYIHNNFGEFVRHSLHRAALFWMVPKIAQSYWLSVSLLSFVGLGLALQDLGFEALPFLIVFGTYPLVYYVSYVFPKYRHPIEPFMFVLAGYAIVTAVRVGGHRVQQLANPEPLLAKHGS